MEASDLFDMFVAHGVTTDEIAGMDIETAIRHINELRAMEPDELELSSREIAESILMYARLNGSLRRRI